MAVNSQSIICTKSMKVEGTLSESSSCVSTVVKQLVEKGDNHVADVLDTCTGTSHTVFDKEELLIRIFIALNLPLMFCLIVSVTII